MNHPLTGVVEGFFGPAWPMDDRKSYAAFLARHGGGFYIYAPKQDPHLRKAWREPWDASFLSKLRDLQETFSAKGVAFGVGFSPFGMGTTLTDVDKELLKKKVRILSDLKVELLGLFFDDMPITDNLAATQIETVLLIQSCFRGKIVFCPSFYTFDPILEKVFGKMPVHYLEDIAAGIPQGISIAWTGPKVISPTIDEAHLKEVNALLKRPPYIWENLYANDGPRNCKFLKLKTFSGRDRASFAQVEAVAFNLMNQAHLSKILYLSSRYVLDGMEENAALDMALKELCSPKFVGFFREWREAFLTKGLDVLSEEEKQYCLEQLVGVSDPAAEEVRAWLRGEFVVGSECLTD